MSALCCFVLKGRLFSYLPWRWCMYTGQGDTGVKLSYELKINWVLVMIFSSPLFLAGWGGVGGSWFSEAAFRKRFGMKQVLQYIRPKMGLFVSKHTSCKWEQIEKQAIAGCNRQAAARVFSPFLPPPPTIFLAFGLCLLLYSSVLPNLEIKCLALWGSGEKDAWCTWQISKD